jgi:putative GTP pyrophosphokinase
MDEFRRAEIDRLGEAMRQRDLTDEEVDLYNAYRGSFRPTLDAVLAALKDAGAPSATERQKTIWSTAAKLRRSTARLSQVQDIAGFRVVVPLKLDQDELINRLTPRHPGWRIIDRRDRPSHGYRAVHALALIDRRHVEIQVRTELQHLWAEVSEACDRAYPGIKYGTGPPDVLSTLGTTSDLVAVVERSEGLVPDEVVAASRRRTRALLNAAMLVLPLDVRNSPGSP